MAEGIVRFSAKRGMDLPRDERTPPARRLPVAHNFCGNVVIWVQNGRGPNFR